MMGLARATAWMGVLGLAACVPDNAAPEVLAVEPAVVSPSVATPALVRGRNFYNAPSVQIDDPGAPAVDRRWRVLLGARPADAVAWRDRETLTMVVPAGLAPGRYDVTATAPDGATATLPNGLTVGEEAPDAGVDAAPADLATPDLATPDLAVDDLATPDLAMDLALPDLAPPDLVGADLALPACMNGVRDGDETGIDCGGACQALCPGDPCPGMFPCATGVCDGASGRCALASGPPAWLPAAPLPTARSGAGAALGPDGLIYVIGGETGNNMFSTTVETYDAFADAWATVQQPLPTARSGLCAAAGADARVYALGGTAGANNYLAVDEAYAPAGAAWNNPPPPDLPLPVWDGAAVALGGRIYVVGGYNFKSGYLPNLSIYPVANAWAAGAAMPTARYGLGAAAGPDGRIYAVGGFTNMGAYLATVEAYAPGNDTWDKTPAPLHATRFGHAALAAPDGRIYAVGGGAAMLTATVEAYSASSNSWATSVAPLAGPRSFPAAAVGPDGRMYVFGGANLAKLSTVEGYGPRVRLAPASGKPGDAVQVSGDDFAASATVVVLWNGAPSPVATGASDALGVLPAVSFTVPQVAAGSYPVVVRDARSQYPVTARFTVQ